MTWLTAATRCVAYFAIGWAGLAVAASPSVFLEDLTSTEVRALVAAGSTTVLIPIGGTEQNGPHMALGKHNVRVKFLAGQIAKRLGNAVVAPVLGYVPEGAIFPPVAHMRFQGTISIPEATFESLLEAAAKSFKQHGFRDVVFLGDHGGYQRNEARAADKVNKAWAADPQTRAHAVTAFYEAAQAPYIQALRNKGYSDAEIGTHAGLADTSLMLAIDKSLVRTDMLAEGAKTSPADGVYGDPRKSSAELGQIGVQIIVDKSVRAIQVAIQRRTVPYVPQSLKGKS
jgi:creatinine amidohydrolase/Fe(II)-dependent formamide hydrolase-like protein